MSVMAQAAARDDWMLDDLDALPAVGQQYELVDGMLLVTPPPLIPHQLVAHLLANVLDPAMPRELLVVPGPAQVTHGDRTSLEPDFSVVRRADVLDGKLIAPPLLVVEVLSPSTRSKDLVLKRSVYAEIGIPSYWIVDTTVPSVVVLELEAGSYVERARAQGRDRVSVTQPVAVTFEPAQLVDDPDSGSPPN